MQQDKNNNSKNWQLRLDDLQADENFNKKAVWDKLHENMQRNPRQRKIVWYWAAAACIISGLLISFLFVNIEHNNLVKNIPVKKKDVITMPGPQKNNVVIVGSKIFAITDHKILQKVKHVIVLKNSDDKKMLQPVTGLKKVNVSVPENITDKAQMPVNAVTALTVNIPSKKQLKVVHINELSSEPVQRHDEKYNEYASSPFFHALNPVDESIPQKVKTGFKILTIKNISTN